MLLLGVQGCGKSLAAKAAAGVFSVPLLRLDFGVLYNKYYVDEVYDAAVVRPLVSGSRSVLWRFIDAAGIDGIVNGVGWAVRGAGMLLRFIQTGLVRSYVALILVGAAIVIVYFTFYERIALYLAR